MRSQELVERVPDRVGALRGVRGSNQREVAHFGGDGHAGSLGGLLHQKGELRRPVGQQVVGKLA
jgi:hypothetical protein